MEFKPMGGMPKPIKKGYNLYAGWSWWTRFVVWTNTGKFPSGREQIKEIKGAEIQNP